jgi:hypothetical protein
MRFPADDGPFRITAVLPIITETGAKVLDAAFVLALEDTRRFDCPARDAIFDFDASDSGGRTTAIHPEPTPGAGTKRQILSTSSIA